MATSLKEVLGKNVKKLGFGLMRLPTKGDQIDLTLVNKMVDLFLARGFSYFDTSPVYGAGMSEAIAGQAIVARYPRERFLLATKLPMWIVKTPEDMPKVFEASLKAFGTDYIDFYLLHGLSAASSDRFVTTSLGKADEFNAWDFLKKLKAEGKVKHIGFSYHDSAEILDGVLAKHPEVEFVQLQINYTDWDDPIIQSQKCYEVARKHGVNVTIMEPCKGGTLINLPPKVSEILKAYRPEASLASWAIRYSASLDGLVTVLSGMSNMEQVEDNTSFMENFTPLSREERVVLDKANDKLKSVDTIRCTACGYCLAGCPKKIKIPALFSIENSCRVYGDKQDSLNRYGNLIQESGSPADCIACRRCEGSCPQHLPIVNNLKLVAAHFDADCPRNQPKPGTVI